MQLLSLANESNIKQLPLKTLLVQLELLGIIQAKYSYFADFKIKLLQPLEQILARFDENRRDFLARVFNAVAFKKVWGSLDFNQLLQDASIERGRVITALEYLQQQELIVLETKAMTDVYAVQANAIATQELSKQLHQYFVDKERKEIARIANLVDFFQLKTCLSVNLACYFDDISFQQQMTQQSGRYQCCHCSVCRGHSISLTVTNQDLAWPSEEIILPALAKLKNALADKTHLPITIESYCRFLAGMTSPLFTRNKVRQMNGFGLCQQHAYQDIREHLAQLLQH